MGFVDQIWDWDLDFCLEIWDLSFKDLGFRVRLGFEICPSLVLTFPICLPSQIFKLISIKKALGIFRELISRRRRKTTTTRVAFGDLPSGSKKGVRT